MTDFSYRDFSNINDTGEGTDFTKPPYTYDKSYQSATGSLTMLHTNIDKYYAANGWIASTNGEITISGGELSENDEITIVDAYETSKSYLGKTTGVSGDIDLVTGKTIFIVGSSIQNSRDALLTAINHKNGHNGSIQATANSTDKIELTQTGGGSDGSITKNTDTNNRIAIQDFSGSSGSTCEITLKDYGEANIVTFSFDRQISIIGYKNNSTDYKIGLQDLPYNAGITVIGDCVANAINLANQNGDLRITAINDNGIVKLTQDIKGSSGETSITLVNGNNVITYDNFIISEDLSISQFINADFTGANLTNCNLSYINLTGANFTGANLTGANLIGASLFKNIYSFRGDGFTNKFYFPNKEKVPDGPTEYFKGQDEQNLKWTVTITTSSGTIDMSEKFIINNKVYPNIITFYNLEKPPINSLIIAKFTCNNTIFNNANLTNIKTGKNMIVNPIENFNKIILPLKYKLYQYSDTNICKIIDNKINIDGRNINEYPLMLKKGQSYIFDVSHESNLNYKLFFSNKNNDDLKIKDWSVKSYELISDNDDFSQQSWDVSNNGNNNSGWEDLSNPNNNKIEGKTFFNKINGANLTNTLQNGGLIRNEEYTLTFTIEMNPLNMSIRVKTPQDNYITLKDSKNYTVGSHTVHFKYLDNYNNNKINFNANVNNYGQSILRNVSLKKNYNKGSNYINIDSVSNNNILDDFNTDDKLYNNYGDEIGIVTSIIKGVDIVSIVKTENISIVTTLTDHNYSVGDKIYINATSHNEYNEYVTITSILSANLIAQYNFEGNFNDSSGNNRNLINNYTSIVTPIQQHPHTSTTVASLNNSCLYLPYKSLDMSSYKQFSISFWAKISSGAETEEQYFFSQGTTNMYDYLHLIWRRKNPLNTNQEYIQFGSYGDTYIEYDLPKTPNVDKWIFIAITYDTYTKTQTLHIQGNSLELSDGTTTGNRIDITNSHNNIPYLTNKLKSDFYIGSYRDNKTSNLQINDFRIYDYNLTTSEVNDIYNNNQLTTGNNSFLYESNKFNPSINNNTITGKVENTLNFQNLLNLNVRDNEQFYKKLPERSYSPGNQHSTYAKSDITFLGNDINEYDGKEVTIKDYKNNSITYTFDNSSQTTTNTVGIQGLTTTNELASKLKDCINSADGHGINGFNTITVSVINNIVNLRQKLSGEIGNKEITTDLDSNLIFVKNFYGGKTFEKEIHTNKHYHHHEHFEYIDTLFDKENDNNYELINQQKLNMISRLNSTIKYTVPNNKKNNIMFCYCLDIDDNIPQNLIYGGIIDTENTSSEYVLLGPHVDISEIQISNKTMKEFDLTNVNLTNSILQNINFEYVDFTNAIFTSAEILNCAFKNTTFSKTNLNKTVIIGSNFDDNILTQSYFEKAEFGQQIDKIVNYDHLYKGDVLKGDKVATDIEGYTGDQLKPSVLALPYNKKYNLDGCIFNGEYFEKFNEKLLIQWNGTTKRYIMTNYRVRDGNINGDILWYLKDNGSEFSLNNPGRKIIKNDFGNPYINYNLSVNNIENGSKGLEFTNENNSIFFDGIDNYITIPYNQTLVNCFNNQYTLECFVFLKSNTILNSENKSQSVLFGHMDTESSNMYWSFGITQDNGLGFFFKSNNNPINIVTSKNLVSLNEWNHIAMTYNNNTELKLWLNGKCVKIFEEDVNVFVGIDIDNNTGISIGKFNTDKYLHGYISNLRVSTTIRYGSQGDTYTVPTENFISDQNTNLLIIGSGNIIEDNQTNHSLNINGVINKTANPFPNTLLITSLNNGLSDESIVTITNTNFYDGVYKISDVTVNTFKVELKFSYIEDEEKGVISYSGLINNDESNINVLRTSGWLICPFINNSLFIENESIKNKEFKITSIFNETRKINLIGGENIIPTDILNISLDNTVGINLNQGNKINKKQLNNFITINFNSDFNENNTLSFWESFNIEENKQVTTNLINNNLEFGKIQFIESQKLVVAWYEEKRIEKIIKGGSEGFLEIENNIFNDYDIIKYELMRKTKIEFISNSTQAFVISFSHGFKEGDLIIIKNVCGMKEINNNIYLVGYNTDIYSIELLNKDDKTNIDTTNFNIYTDGGFIELYRQKDTVSNTLLNQQLYYIKSNENRIQLSDLINKDVPILFNKNSNDFSIDYNVDKLITTHCIKLQLYETYEWIEGISSDIGSWYSQNMDKIYKIKDFNDIHVVNITGKLNLENISIDSFIVNWCQYNDYDEKEYSISNVIYNNNKVDKFYKYENENIYSSLILSGNSSLNSNDYFSLLIENPKFIKNNEIDALIYHDFEGMGSDGNINYYIKYDSNNQNILQYTDSNNTVNLKNINIEWEKVTVNDPTWAAYKAVGYRGLHNFTNSNGEEIDNTIIWLISKFKDNSFTIRYSIYNTEIDKLLYYMDGPWISGNNIGIERLFKYNNNYYFVIRQGNHIKIIINNNLPDNINFDHNNNNNKYYEGDSLPNNIDELLLKLDTAYDVGSLNYKVFSKNENYKILSTLTDQMLVSSSKDININKKIDYVNNMINLDSSKWHYQVQFPNGYSWYNNEIQEYTNRIDNSYLSDNKLHIRAIKNDENYTSQGANPTKQYTSARLNSKYAFTYGVVEIRARLPVENGVWPAFWLLGQNINEPGGAFYQSHGDTNWPDCGEIDIMEFWSDNPNFIQSAIHTPSSSGNTINKGGQTISNVTDFHIYKMDWNSERIKFYVDDVEHYTYNPTVKDSSTWPFDNPHYLLLNLAVLPGATFLHQEIIIDYVKIFDQNDTLVWHDYFLTSDINNGFEIISGNIANTVLNNSGKNQTVYTCVTNDDTATFSLQQNTENFSIDETTGVVTLMENPDIENKPYYTFTIEATNNTSTSSINVILGIYNYNYLNEIIPNNLSIEPTHHYKYIYGWYTDKNWNITSKTNPENAYAVFDKSENVYQSIINTDINANPEWIMITYPTRVNLNKYVIEFIDLNFLLIDFKIQGCNLENPNNSYDSTHWTTIDEQIEQNKVNKNTLLSTYQLNNNSTFSKFRILITNITGNQVKIKNIIFYTYLDSQNKQSYSNLNQDYFEVNNENTVFAIKPNTHKVSKSLQPKIINLNKDKFMISWLTNVNNSEIVKKNNPIHYSIRESLETNINDILFIENTENYYNQKKTFGITFLNPPICTLLSDIVSSSTNFTVSRPQRSTDYSSFNNAIFESSGKLLIGNEEIEYSEIIYDSENDSYTFTILNRNFPTNHYIGETVTCKKVTLDSKINDFPQQKSLLNLTYFTNKTYIMKNISNNIINVISDQVHNNVNTDTLVEVVEEDEEFPLGQGQDDIIYVIVTVDNENFLLNGIPYMYYVLYTGITYRFMQQDSSNDGHPFKLSLFIFDFELFKNEVYLYLNSNNPNGDTIVNLYIQYANGDIYKLIDENGDELNPPTLSQSFPNNSSNIIYNSNGIDVMGYIYYELTGANNFIGQTEDYHEYIKSLLELHMQLILQYTTDVTYVGVPGTIGAYTQIMVTNTEFTLSSYCENHSNMIGNLLLLTELPPQDVIEIYVTVGLNEFGDNVFYLNGVYLDFPTFPFILTIGKTYKFIQEDNTNDGYLFKISIDIENLIEYTNNVTYYGTPGTQGAYTQIEITPDIYTDYLNTYNNDSMISFFEIGYYSDNLTYVGILILDSSFVYIDDGNLIPEDVDLLFSNDFENLFGFQPIGSEQDQDEDIDFPPFQSITNDESFTMTISEEEFLDNGVYLLGNSITPQVLSNDLTVIESLFGSSLIALVVSPEYVVDLEQPEQPEVNSYLMEIVIGFEVEDITEIILDSNTYTDGSFQYTVDNITYERTWNWDGFSIQLNINEAIEISSAVENSVNSTISEIYYPEDGEKVLFSGNGINGLMNGEYYYIKKERKPIENISNEIPLEFTVNNHGLIDNDIIFIEGITTTKELNYKKYKIIKVTENTFKIFEIDPITKIPSFSPFDGANVSGDIYTFPSGAQSWAGFQNMNEELKPLSFINGGYIEFTAAVIDGSLSAEIQFKFEYQVYPDTTPDYYTTPILIDHIEEETYKIDIPSQGTNTFSSILMFISERDVEVLIKNISIYGDKATDGWKLTQYNNGGGQIYKVNTNNIQLTNKLGNVFELTIPNTWKDNYQNVKVSNNYDSNATSIDTNGWLVSPYVGDKLMIDGLNKIFTIKEVSDSNGTVIFGGTILTETQDITLTFFQELGKSVNNNDLIFQQQISHCKLTVVNDLQSYKFDNIDNSNYTITFEKNTTLKFSHDLNLTWRELINQKQNILFPEVNIDSVNGSYRYSTIKTQYNIFNNCNIWGKQYEIYLQNKVINKRIIHIEDSKIRTVLLNNDDNVDRKILDSKLSGITKYYDIIKSQNKESIIVTWQNNEKFSQSWLNSYNTIYRREVNFNYNYVKNVETVIFGNLKNAKWKYKTDISNNYVNLQVISLNNNTEVYLWEYNDNTFVNILKNQNSIKFYEINKIKKSKLISYKNVDTFSIVSNEDNIVNGTTIDKIVALQNYSNYGYKLGPYIPLKSSNLTLKTSNKSILTKNLSFFELNIGSTFKLNELINNKEFLNPGVIKIDNEKIYYNQKTEIIRKSADVQIVDKKMTRNTIEWIYPGNIINVNIFVNIEHTYKGDLKVFLLSPNGTRIVLHNQTGGGVDDIIQLYSNTNKDGSEVPEESLFNLNNENPYGIWTLIVNDKLFQDSGRIIEWYLEITQDIVYRGYDNTEPENHLINSLVTQVDNGINFLDSVFLENGTSVAVWQNITFPNYYDKDILLGGIGKYIPTTMRNSDLRAINFENTDLSYILFDNSDLRNSNLKSSTLDNISFYNCDMDNIMLNFCKQTILSNSVNFNKAVLISADLSGSNLNYSNLTNANFINGDLTNAKLNYVDLENSNFMNSDLFNVDLSYSIVSNTKFQDSILLNQKENIFLLKPSKMIGLKLNEIQFKDVDFKNTTKIYARNYTNSMINLNEKVYITNYDYDQQLSYDDKDLSLINILTNLSNVNETFKWKLIDTGDNNGTFYINFTGGNRVSTVNGLNYTKYNVYYDDYSTLGYTSFDDYLIGNQSTDYIQTVLTDGAISNLTLGEKSLLGFHSNTQQFSIKLTGFFKPTISGTYYFKTTSDDGSMVLIDNQIVVDNNYRQPPTARYGSIDLEADTNYEIKIYYGNNFYQGYFSFEWKLNGNSYSSDLTDGQFKTTDGSSDSFSTNKYLTDNIGYYDSNLKWPEISYYSKVDVLEKKNDNTQKWTIYDSGNNDNTVYIKSWRNYYLEYKNGEIVLNKFQNDVNNTWLIWHGTSETESLLSQFEEGNQTAIFYNNIQNLPSDYCMIKRKNDGKRFIIGPSLNLENIDLQTLDFSYMSLWFNNYGLNLKPNLSNYVINNYTKIKLNLYLHKLTLQGSNLINSNFTDCNLGKLILVGCNLSKSTFNGTYMNNAIFYYTDFDDIMKLSKSYKGIPLSNNIVSGGLRWIWDKNWENTFVILDNKNPGLSNWNQNEFPDNLFIKNGYLIGEGVNLTNAGIYSRSKDYQNNLKTANLTNCSLENSILANVDISFAILTNLKSGNIQYTNKIDHIQQYSNNEYSTQFNEPIINLLPKLPEEYKLIKGYIIGPNVNLSNVVLKGLNLNNLNLSGVNLSDACLDGCLISNVNFSNTNLYNIKSKELTFDKNNPPINLPSGWKIKKGCLIGSLTGSSFSYTLNVNDENLNNTTYRNNTTGSPTVSGDESSISIQLPNNFTFYGVNYSTVYVHDNGCIGFDLSDEFPYFQVNLNSINTKKLIAVFYDDLDSSTGNNYFNFTDDNLDGTGTSNSVLIVTWHEIYTFGGNDKNSFEVRLYLNNSHSPGKIVLRYGLVNLNISQYSNARIYGITNENNSSFGSIDILNQTNSILLESAIQLFTKNTQNLQTFQGKELIFIPPLNKSSNLEDTDLTGIDFTDQPNLQYINFKNAILIGANFENCDLSYSNFENANLCEANFKGSILRNVNFKNANLSYANLINADITGAIFTDADQSNQIDTTISQELQAIIDLQNDLNGGKVYASSEERNNDEKLLEKLKIKLQYSSTRYDPNYKFLPGSYSYNYENSTRNM